MVVVVNYFGKKLHLKHCLKSVQIRTEYGPEKTSYLDTFHEVKWCDTVLSTPLKAIIYNEGLTF